MVAAAERIPVFFGLKWKTVLVLSLVLALVNASLAYLVYRKVTGQFEDEQAARRLTQVREFDAVLSKAQESVSTFATFIPRLAVSQVGERDEGLAQRIAAALEEHGMLLDLEWGVEGMHYFGRGPGDDRSERPSVSWPTGRTVPPVDDLLDLAGRDEAPQGRLVCAADCLQLIVLPVLSEGITRGFLVVERSIGDSLKEFHLLSGAEVALLHRTEPGVDDWSRGVSAITHGDLVLPILREVSDQAGLGELADRPRRVALAADWYEVFALPAGPVARDPVVLLINRVTGQVHAVREATTDSILLGISGLLLSEVILLILMWGPMWRIQELVRALPLLAEKAFPRLRGRLSGIGRTGPARDEIDVMVQVIGDVSDQIEALDEAHLAAEQALREREQSLQLAQSMARVAGWTGRPLEGGFTLGPGASRINPILSHVESWSEFLALVHPEDRRDVVTAWRAGRPGGKMDVEFRMLFGEKEVDIHAMAEFDLVGPGRVLQAAGMMQDVSEMRAVQRALKGHRDRLEQQVRERTAELVDARNQAQRLARNKGRFLANMSHEIRTPLNAVLGLAQIGMQQSQNRRIADTFQEILEAGGHLLNVVNDVLDLSRIEAGRVEIQPRAFELREVVRQSASMLGQRAQAKSLSLDVSVADDVPERLVGDPFRLQQILINLLGNAVKFTERGAVSLDVWRVEDDCFFAVRDTGVGIPADQFGRLFAPYRQTGGGGSLRREGTGLGLSISNGLAAMMGGGIRVESRPGEGSEFVLHLPMRRADEHPPVAHEGVPPPLDADRPLEGMRVLVADDVGINRRVLEALLEAEGAWVRSVANGREALDALSGDAGEAFDVVLMDVEMPEMGGREASRAIRSAGLAVPVIGVTAHASEIERAASLAAGMQDQLVKPIMRDALVDAMLGCTRRGRPDAAGVPAALPAGPPSSTVRC